MARFKSSYLKAVFFFLVNCWFLSLVTLMADRMCKCVPVIQILFIQYLTSFIILLPYTLRRGVVALKTKFLKLHIFRAVLMVIGGFMYVTSMKFIPAINAMLVENSSPLFIPIISMIWLKETLPKRLWLSVLLGFFGVYMILSPKEFGFTPFLLLPVLAAICTSVGAVSIRKLAEHEPVERIMFYFFGIGTILTMPFFLKGGISEIPWAYLPELITIGSLFGFSMLFMAFAYTLSMPGKLAPFVYSESIFTLLLSLTVLNVLPTSHAYWGMALILISAGIMIFRPYSSTVEKIDHEL